MRTNAEQLLYRWDDWKESCGHPKSEGYENSRKVFLLANGKMEEADRNCKPSNVQQSRASGISFARCS